VADPPLYRYQREDAADDPHAAQLTAVVFLAGALNLCLFAPLFGAPFLGKNVK
jgi:hypothetical protein